LGSIITYEIIDGQQRINAIYKFANNGFRLFDPKRDKTGLPRFLGQESCSWGGMTFEMLPQELKDKFLNTELQMNIIETENSHEVRELFVRLQSGLPLNAQEKRDAWPGELSKFIVNLAGKRPSVVGHPFWSELVYRGAEKRGSLRQACAQAFMTFYSRHSNGPEAFCGLESKQIDEFYRHNLDFDTNAPGSTSQRFRRILDEAYDLLRDGQRPPLRIHAALHTILFIDSLDQFTNDCKNKFAKALDKFLANLAQATKDETNEYWLQYGILARTGSNSKDSVYKRHEFFVKKMLEFMAPLKRKDPTRDYSREERELLYFLKSKKCDVCGKAIKWSEAEIHHHIPHSNGGPTSLENANLVHRTPCHPRGKSLLTPEAIQALETETTDIPWDIDEVSSTEYEQEQ